MPRISAHARAENEAAIRAAMDRILAGNLPLGGKCDIKTLAAEAGVSRTAFYPKQRQDGTLRPGPYQHLAEEFDRRLNSLRAAGSVTDPRVSQIMRLKAKVADLQERLAHQEHALAKLAAFKTLAVSRIAAQHDEIRRLRKHIADNGNIRALSLPDQ